MFTYINIYDLYFIYISYTCHLYMLYTWLLYKLYQIYLLFTNKSIIYITYIQICIYYVLYTCVYLCIYVYIYLSSVCVSMEEEGCHEGIRPGAPSLPLYVPESSGFSKKK